MWLGAQVGVQVLVGGPVAELKAIWTLAAPSSCVFWTSQFSGHLSSVSCKMVMFWLLSCFKAHSQGVLVICARSSLLVDSPQETSAIMSLLIGVSSVMPLEIHKVVYTWMMLVDVQELVMKVGWISYSSCVHFGFSSLWRLVSQLKLCGCVGWLMQLIFKLCGCVYSYTLGWFLYLRIKQCGCVGWLMQGKEAVE